MLKKQFLFVLLATILSVLLSSFVVTAQDVGVDDQGNPNDPTINDRANACYTDSRFVDQCDTPIEWFCGYVVIRYDYGLYDRDTVANAGCGAYLPPEAGLIPMASSNTTVDTAPSIAFPTAGCLFLNTNIFIFTDFYIDFMGGNYVPAGAPSYVNNTCLGTGPPLFASYVYAPDGLAVAEQLCIMNGDSGLFGLVVGNIYRCQP